MKTKRELRQEAVERLTELWHKPHMVGINGADVLKAAVGEYYVDFIAYLRDLITLLEDDDAYMRVPVDVDDVPIHIGDRVVEHEDGHDFIVDGYEYDGEWWVFHRDGVRAPANMCTHYKVEDVLSEFVEKVYENAWNDGKEGVRYHMYEHEKLVKAYAEKLRLKEDKDEDQA